MDKFEQALAEAKRRLMRQSPERHEVWLTKSRVLSADEINLLPEKLRSYIHDLISRSDPAGDIRAIAVLTEQRDALVLKIKELKAQLEELNGTEH